VRALGTAAVAAALLLVLGATASARSTVHLRGTAYEFNTPTVIGGATIRVAENPRLRAITRPSGAYDLVVPARSRVTPYIVAPGYHTIYLQTFRTNGADLRNVNFQTPTTSVFQALAALLNVPVDASGELTGCAIVSTISTRNIRDLSYPAFRAYGAHGVAGATASSAPPLPGPVYFNSDVVPDPSQPVSSDDGGVVWTDVPTGVYRISARSPEARFASFVATCRPGRAVNANPPWGLHELGLENPATVSASWSVAGGQARLRSLAARHLPPDAVLRVSCSGPGCPFRRKTVKATRGTVDLRRALGGGAMIFAAGQTLEVGVFAHTYNGTVERWRIVSDRTPRATTVCVPLGDTAPQRRCPS
jgi:hypothetical protein